MVFVLTSTVLACASMVYARASMVHARASTVHARASMVDMHNSPAANGLCASDDGKLPPRFSEASHATRTFVFLAAFLLKAKKLQPSH